MRPAQIADLLDAGKLAPRVEKEVAEAVRADTQDLRPRNDPRAEPAVQDTVTPNRDGRLARLTHSIRVPGQSDAARHAQRHRNEDGQRQRQECARSGQAERQQRR